MTAMNRLLLVTGIFCTTLPALADTPEVVEAHASRTGDFWSISVTLSHPDSGWDHYADAWQILAPDGTTLGTRDLAHPHVEEQPFTRSLDGLTIPKGLDHVMIRVRCNLDGWSPRLIWLDLPNE